MHPSLSGQYRSLVFGKPLAESGIAAPMGSRGDAYDNAAMESEAVASIFSWAAGRQKAEKMEHRRVWGAERSATLRDLDLVFSTDHGTELSRIASPSSSKGP